MADPRPDPYDVLGIPRDADAAAIKAAWRKAARLHHPDRGGDIGAFTSAQGAWELLADPLRRRFFDRFGQDPHTLGLEGAAIQQALRARLAGEPREEIKRPPRAECDVCEGTGIRPSGRSCTACDPNARSQPSGGPDWDPTASAGRRVRVGKRAAPKPAPTFFARSDAEAPRPEPKPVRPQHKRFRLRKKDEG